MIHPIHPIRFLLPLLIAGFYLGCTNSGSIKEGEVVAKYKDQYLLADEILASLPRDLESQDSLRLSRLYIDNWLTSQVLEDKAMSTIPNLEKKLSTKLSEYKNQLIEYEYMRYVIQRNLYEAISPQEIRNYYLQNLDKFISETTYYSFFYIMSETPLEADLVSSIRSKDPVLLEQLIEWCAQQEQVEYKLDSTFTMESELDLVNKGFPLNIKQVPLNQVYSYNNKEEETGKTYHHLFKLLSVVKPGEKKPISMCEEEIKGIMLNQRKRKLLDQTKNWLVDQAKMNRDIEIY